jgi:hypothetical protein
MAGRVLGMLWVGIAVAPLLLQGCDGSSDSMGPPRPAGGPGSGDEAGARPTQTMRDRSEV